jgi:hypothetical protein
MQEVQYSVYECVLSLQAHSFRLPEQFLGRNLIVHRCWDTSISHATHPESPDETNVDCTARVLGLVVHALR